MGAGKGYSAIRYSKSKRGWHVAVLLREKISPMVRVAMEAILGDDPMRAAMNFARARNEKLMPKFWKQRWNILYDYKVLAPGNANPLLRGVQSRDKNASSTKKHTNGTG
jgi:hypothetical protein